MYSYDLDKLIKSGLSPTEILAHMRADVEHVYDKITEESARNCGCNCSDCKSRKDTPMTADRLIEVIFTYLGDNTNLDKLLNALGVNNQESLNELKEILAELVQELTGLVDIIVDLSEAQDSDDNAAAMAALVKLMKVQSTLDNNDFLKKTKSSSKSSPMDADAILKAFLNKI